MCNLYRLDKAPAEIAKLFRVPNVPGFNFAYEVYPGYTGLVIAGGRMRTAEPIQAPLMVSGYLAGTKTHLLETIKRPISLALDGE